VNRFATIPPDLASHARERRSRLIERIAGSRLDGVLLTDPREITYFTACPLRTPAQAPACLLIRTSGESVLVCADSTCTHAADLILTYHWHNGGTIPTELMPRLIDLVVPRLRLTGARIGVQRESISAQLVSSLSLGASEPIDRLVSDLERSKDSLDLFRIRAAIQSNLAAFKSIADAITPGATELEIFAAGSRGAMLAAGEKVVHDGDYQCGTPGGPCRNRPIHSREIYTIDAWTQVAGYWSDLARAFPVGVPTDAQSQLINHVQRVHSRIRPLLRPGNSGNDIWCAMDAALREHTSVSGLTHHGGHGIGLRLHEAPDINPAITDTLRPGDVICIEPGAYLPHANVRIEETYLITSDGAECLSTGTLESASKTTEDKGI
jgi:Xaa-Pro aminopeptidase